MRSTRSKMKPAVPRNPESSCPLHHPSPASSAPDTPAGGPAVPSERIMLALLCSALAAIVMTGLMLADNASWPAALIVGLGAGGATLLGVLTLFGRVSQP